MIVALPGQTPAILGFAVPAGLAFAVAATLFLAYPPLPESPVEDARPPGVAQLYITIREPIFISLGEGPKMKLDLAVSVEGTSAQLLELNATVDNELSRVKAAIVSEAQGLVMEGADSRQVHAALPDRARATINGMLGSEAFPAPVTEVLILGLAMQG
ncbi:hypothetical protein C0V75_14440 [Tabrizicola sp. TH137]|uniref:hypothetical protein n=1 Tax=Tabrizicola sp. TH137 TaxID=2067452 RepID=UPI000C7ADEA2|nr:hypothetical protein [Tabrizicola sp. TH137]PLL12078.1 hypothetical protein C0V75_14440 [Tabrizicola sp. TH137]